jgi:hypothetical protein
MAEQVKASDTAAGTVLSGSGVVSLIFIKVGCRLRSESPAAAALQGQRFVVDFS